MQVRRVALHNAFAALMRADGAATRKCDGMCDSCECPPAKEVPKGSHDFDDDVDLGRSAP